MNWMDYSSRKYDDWPETPLRVLKTCNLPCEAPDRVTQNVVFVPDIWADRPAFYELIRPNIFTRRKTA